MIRSQSARPRAAVPKMACRPGRHITTACKRTEESTAKTSQMLAKGPTLKMDCYSERQLKALNISNTVIMVKALVWAFTSPSLGRTHEQEVIKMARQPSSDNPPAPTVGLPTW